MFPSQLKEINLHTNFPVSLLLVYDFKSIG